MSKLVLRQYRDESDAARQYQLWLDATDHLPRAWRSCLRNVQSQLRQAKRFPRCRCYAEDPDSGNLVGYIGTHPPFNWVGSKHGPPNESLGWTIPFGFPWTYPHDDALADRLYRTMLEWAAEIYRDFPKDIHIQRFRESWKQQLAFLKERGWRQIARVPLLGIDCDSTSCESGEWEPVSREDLSLISELSEQDPTVEDGWTLDEVCGRYDGGWIVNDTFWRCAESGAFALEPRGRHAAVTVFFAKPDAWVQTVRAAMAQAGALGCEEIYFTVEEHETARRSALTDLGFGAVDAGVYMVREAS